MTTEFAYNGDGVRTSKTAGGDTTQYVLDLAATLPVVISDTEAVYLYGLDIIAQQEVLRRGSGQAPRLHYMHDGLSSVRQLLGNSGHHVNGLTSFPPPEYNLKATGRSCVRTCAPQNIPGAPGGWREV